MGVVIGGMIIALYLPMFSVINLIKVKACFPQADSSYADTERDGK